MALNLDAIGKRVGPVTSEYNWKDLVLYALGVGAGFDELEYVYENQLKVIPTFAILSIYDFFSDFITISGVNLAGILHGEHELIVHSPLPPEGGSLISEGSITEIYDKGAGRGALIVGEIDTHHSQGQKLYTNRATAASEGNQAQGRGSSSRSVSPTLRNWGSPHRISRWSTGYLAISLRCTWTPTLPA
jgi:hypothetical protein